MGTAGMTVVIGALAGGSGREVLVALKERIDVRHVRVLPG
jgi:hypothetical protein